jgi:ferredoxin
MTGTDWTAVKTSLVDLARRRGAEVARVGDPSVLEAAAPGQRPSDLLPETRSMIVLAGSAPRAGEWHSPRPELMETVGTADRMSALGSALARHIEETLGYYALNVPTATDREDKAFLDFKAAAIAAGAGTASLAGPVLHPDHGFLYLTVVLTSLPLPPDGPLDTPACPAPSCVQQWEEQGSTPCLAVCPIDDGGCLGGAIEQGVVIGRRYDEHRCRDRVYHYWVPGYQTALERALDEPDPRKRKMILYGSYFTRTMWSITYSNVSQGQCFECIRVCPVDARRRELA